MTKRFKKTLAGLLTFCLVFGLLCGVPRALAETGQGEAKPAAEETPQEEMTAEKLLSLMSVRRYIFSDATEETEEKNRVVLTAGEDGKLHADVKNGTLKYEDVLIELKADTLAPDPQKEGVYTVLGVMPDFEVENTATFTVADGAVVLIETKFGGANYSCRAETFPVTCSVIGSGELKADPAEAWMGQTVKLKATPADRYRLASTGASFSAVVAGESKAGTIELEAGCFVMPSFALTGEDKLTVEARAEFELRGYWSEEWLAAVEEGKAVERLPYANSGKYNAILFAMEDRPETLAEVPGKVAAVEHAIRVYVESNALAEGYGGSEDMSWYIQNAEEPAETEPWVLDGTGTVTVAEGWPYIDGEDRTAERYFEADALAGDFDFGFTQDVELPVGEYIFTVKLRGSGVNLMLMADDERLEVTPKDSGGAFGFGWNDYTLEFSTDGDGPVSLGLLAQSAEAGAFVDFSDFRLAMIGLIALPETYAVLCPAAEHGTVRAEPEEAYAGDTVTLYAEPESGYELQSLRVVDENGEEVAVSGSSFVMPGSTVTVTAVFSLIKYDIRIEPCENGRITTDKTRAAVGETVTITAEPDEGYALWQLFVDAENGTTILLDNLSFTMPASPVTIVAAFDQPHTIKVARSFHGTVAADRTEAVEGEIVRLTITPDEDYALDTLDVLSEEEPLELSEDYCFEMPRADVSVTATFKRAAYYLVFDENGHGTAPEALRVPVDTTAEAPAPDPTAAGYDFEGWYEDQKCTKAFDFTQPLTEERAKALADANGEITLYAKWTAFKYEFTEGQQKTWQKNGTGSLSFTVKRSTHDDWTFDNFEKLVFDGKDLKKDTDYSVEAGSLKITLYASTLNTKAVNAAGYKLKAVFSDGETEKEAVIKVTSAATTPTAKPTKTTTTTPKTENPATGDNSNIGLWAVICGAALIALVVLVVLLKKQGGNQR